MLASAPVASAARVRVLRCPLPRTQGLFGCAGKLVHHHLMARKVVFVLIVAVAGLSWSTGFAAADEAQSPDKRQTHELPASLRVVVVGSTPFIEEAANGELTGPSLEVWRRAAGDMGVSYELTRADSVDAALAQVASHQVDVAVGPISITAQRATQVAFTQPYFSLLFGHRFAARRGLFPARGAIPLRCVLDRPGRAALGARRSRDFDVAV